MKYAVVSYWVGEAGDTEIWLYNSEKEAQHMLNKLWQQSFELAEEDKNFDEENSYQEDNFAVVAWKDNLCRYFEVVIPNVTEK